MKTRILLADDHQLFREALCHLLDSQSDLEVAGQVGNGLEVVEQARRTGAQIVCMDISMPGMHGAEVTRSLLTALPLVKVVALSAYSDRQYVLDMLQAGAMAYVTKAEASEERRDVAAHAGGFFSAVWRTRELARRRREVVESGRGETGA